MNDGARVEIYRVPANYDEVAVEQEQNGANSLTDSTHLMLACTNKLMASANDLETQMQNIIEDLNEKTEQADHYNELAQGMLDPNPNNEQLSNKKLTKTQAKELINILNQNPSEKHYTMHDFYKEDPYFYPYINTAQAAASVLADAANDQVTASTELQTKLNELSTTYTSVLSLCSTILSNTLSLLRGICSRM